MNSNVTNRPKKVYIIIIKVIKILKGIYIIFIPVMVTISIFPQCAMANARRSRTWELTSPGTVAFLVPTRESMFTTALVGQPRVQRPVVISRNRRNDTTCRATKKLPFKSHPRPVNTSMWDEKYFYGTGEYAFFKQNLVSLEDHLIRWRDTMRPSHDIVLGWYNLDIENSCTQLRLLMTSEWK